jgi:hypothetical protein
VSDRVREQTEVLVFGQKHSRLSTGESEDGFVLRARIELHDCGNVVADSAKSRDNDEVAALVGEETHGSVSTLAGVFADEDDLFVRDGIGRVTHRRLDILARESRVRVNEICLGGAFAQLAKDEFDRNPRSTDDRLPKHHSRVHFDTIGERHSKPRSANVRLLSTDRLGSVGTMLALPAIQSATRTAGQGRVHLRMRDATPSAGQNGTFGGDPTTKTLLGFLGEGLHRFLGDLSPFVA